MANNKKPKYNEIVFSEEQEKQIIDMYTNQIISTVKIGNIFNCGNKTIAKVLEKHNIPRTGVGKRVHSLNEHYFDVIDTPNKAYILGMLYADGYNCLSKCTVRLQLQYTDKDILESIRMELDSKKELNFIRCSDKVSSNGFISKDMYQLEIYSSHMCKTLEKLGMVQNKSLVLTFPTFLDSTFYSHFIRGYFDGDGSYCHRYVGDKYGNSDVITITSTESFCNDCLNIIRQETGIGGGIYDASNHNGITKVLSISGVNQANKFFEWLYKDAELYLKRKHNLYMQFLVA